MKTVKIIFIVGLLSVFTGCSKVVKDAGDWSVEEAGKGNLSVSVVYDDLVLKSLTDYTNVTTDEKAVKKLDVLVFDKVTGALNASMSLESMTDECQFALPVGDKVVYAVVNGPDVSSVTSEEGLLALSDNLSDRSFSGKGLLMMGKADCQIEAGKTASPVIAGKWLGSRVVLRKITCNLASQYKTMSVNCVYLGNANTVQTLAGESSVMVNPDGYADAAKTKPVGKSEMGACYEYMFKYGSGDINVGGFNSTIYRLYCQPNETDKHTCLYIAVVIDYTTYYYRIPLINGLKAGSTCSVDVTISNLGSLLPPDTDYVTGGVAAKIQFGGWDAGEAYVVEF